MYRQGQVDSVDLHTLDAQQQSTSQLLERVSTTVSALLLRLRGIEGKAAIVDKDLARYVAAPENAGVPWVRSVQASRTRDAL